MNSVINSLISTWVCAMYLIYFHMNSQVFLLVFVNGHEVVTNSKDLFKLFVNFKTCKFHVIPFLFLKVSLFIIFLIYTWFLFYFVDLSLSILQHRRRITREIYSIVRWKRGPLYVVYQKTSTLRDHTRYKIRENRKETVK